MDIYRHRPKEVFRVRPGVLLAAVFVSLLLEVTLPPTLPLAYLFQFPLLVVIYFSMVRENQTFGVFLGTAVGLVQDALSHGYLGEMGMAKAVVGYLAAAVGLRFEFDNLVVRALLIGTLVLIHNSFLYFLTHELLGLPAPFEIFHLLASALVNMAIGLVLFPVFDRFKLPA